MHASQMKRLCFATSLLTVFERHLQEGEIKGNMPNSVYISRIPRLMNNRNYTIQSVVKQENFELCLFFEVFLIDMPEFYIS